MEVLNMEASGRKRIGLMGGTFSPIHYGHLLIAENAFEQFQLDEVIFVPAGNPPHKDKNQVLGSKARMEMIELAIADNPHFSCSDYEIQKEDVCYTYLTLEAFQKRLGGSTQLYFIMGADSLAYFDSWKRPDEISRMSIILAAVRDGLNREELVRIKEKLEAEYNTRIGFISTPNFSVSSRIIRQRLAGRQSIRYLVPDAVEQYLKQHQFFSQKAVPVCL